MGVRKGGRLIMSNYEHDQDPYDAAALAESISNTEMTILQQLFAPPSRIHLKNKADGSPRILIVL
jgi:hypothetical protein